MRSQSAGEDDVLQCDSAWEMADVDSVPSLAEVLRQWEEFYQVEELNDETPQGLAGNDDPDTSAGQQY